MKNWRYFILAGFLFASCAEPVVHNHYYGEYVENGGTGGTTVSGEIIDVMIITTNDSVNGTIDHYIGIGWVVYKDNNGVVKITRPDGTVAYQRP